mmetsp:Transcript_13717/g.38680  ORF Transcript_13717/g.38680 Transcript_13717/m.38680 type:complete len:200 (-) Transcript_13717:802-1401(-)
MASKMSPSWPFHWRNIYTAGLRCKYGRLEASTVFLTASGFSLIVTSFRGGGALAIMSRKVRDVPGPAVSSLPVAVCTAAASDRTECLAARDGLLSKRAFAISTALVDGPWLTRSPALVEESQSGCCCVSPTTLLLANLEARERPDRMDPASSSPSTAFHLLRNEAFQSSPSSSVVSAMAVRASSSEISSARAAAWTSAF